MRHMVIALSFALLAAPASADISTNPQSAPKGRYRIDPPHAVVTFCIPHFGGVANYCGWLTKIGGTLDFDGAQPAKSKINVTIDMAQVMTRSAELDQRLKDDFFRAATFPTATFESTAVKVTGKNAGEITGNLTINGMTKPMTLKARFNGGQPRPIGNGYLIGFSGDGTIKLADFPFGDVAWRVFVGDEVLLHFETEFINEQ